MDNSDRPQQRDDEPQRDVEPQQRDDDDAPLDLDAMARLMGEQRRIARRGDARLVTLTLLTWGAVWCVGFLALWSGQRGGNPWFQLPGVTEWIVFGGAMLVGVLISLVLGLRMGRGVRGRSADSGALYGWSWLVVTVASGATLAGLARAGLDYPFIGVVAPALFILPAGVMYLAGAAMWRSYTSFALGCSVLGVVALATIVGVPHHNLVYALGGAVLMPLFAWLTWRGMMRDPSTRPAPSDGR